MAMVDSNAESTYQFVHSWVRKRKQGVHGLTLPIWRDQFACSDCIDLLRKGIPVGQMKLFGLDIPDDKT